MRKSQRKNGEDAASDLPPTDQFEPVASGNDNEPDDLPF